MYPFVRKKGSIILKLHKDLYKKETILRIAKEEPDFLNALSLRKQYYLLEFKNADYGSCLDFLNYLIYLERNA